MKNNLLTLAALAWASSALAGSWDAPVAPSEANAAQIENEGHYYATIVGTGQFLRGSNSWGTQGSLDKQGYEVVMYADYTPAAWPEEHGWAICFPTIKIGTDQYAGDLMFCDNGTGIFCNAYNGSNSTSINANRDHTAWTLTLNPDGKTYRISNIACTAGDNTYLGWDGGTLGSSNVPQLAYLEEGTMTEVTDEEGNTTEVEAMLDWAFIPAHLYAVYTAKVALYDKLNEAEEKGITNLDDILAVYNNPDATVEEVEKAMGTLSDRIMNNVQAGEEVDVTSTYIKNADCSATEGWSGFNTQSHNYPEGGPTEEGAQITGQFFEKWLSGTPLADATLVQNITVPAGKYRLQADVIASWQDDGDVEVEGVYLYADGGTGLQKSEPISTANRVPQKISVEFTCTGEAKIGLMIESTNANWVAVDNFKLFFQGYIDNPNAIALEGLITTLEGYEESYEDEGHHFSAATKAELEDLKGRCESAKGGSEEELGVLVEEGKQLTEKIDKEIAAYKKLYTFIAKVEEDTKAYGSFGSFGNSLGDYYSELLEKYDDGALSAEEIDELMAAYDQMVEDGVRDYIATEAQPGDDISVLIKNRDMDEGTGWTGKANQPQIPGWAGTSPWGYDQSAAEFWNMDFDFYQDIEGLPQGKYTVSFQGFYRVGPNDTWCDVHFDNPEEEQANIIARIYCNSVETPFKSVYEGAHALREGEGEGGLYNTNRYDDNGNLLYVPNSMTTFANQIKADPVCYHTEATGIVGADGKLRIGIKASGHQGDSWVIFDSFRLRYDGNDASMYGPIIDEQIAALQLKRDNTYAEHPLPQDLYDSVDQMAVDAEAVKSGSADDCLAFMDKIAAKSAEIDDVLKVIAAYEADCAYYQENDDLMEATSEEFAQLLDEAYSKFEVAGESPWATTADLVAEAHNLNATFVAGVFAKGEGATEKNPYDMSAVIRNPQFTDVNGANSGAYWNGANGSANNEEYEFYNKNFDLNQTISGLPKGYYTVTVDGYYRQGTAQAHADSIAADLEDLAALLYVAVGDAEAKTTPLMSIFSGAPDTDIREATNDNGDFVGTISEIELNGGTSIVPLNMACAREYLDKGFYAGNAVMFNVAEETADVVVGIKKEHTYQADWTLFDNFQLFYLGQSAPDAIKNILNNSGLAVKQEYYTVGGLLLARPQKGVNIVVTTLTDGTKVSSKVIVK